MVEEFKGDKRTKEYKEWKAKYDAQSKGLGDDIEKITKATGIKAVVDKVSEVTGIDCGCDDRKDKYNKIFPRRKVECLTEEEHRYLSEFFSDEPVLITGKVQSELLKISNRIFHKRNQMSSCTPCVRGMINELKKIFDVK